jgi:hypothetical protein
MMKFKIKRRGSLSSDENNYIKVKIWGNSMEVEAIYNAVTDTMCKLMPEMENHRPKLKSLAAKIRDGMGGKSDD